MGKAAESKQARALNSPEDYYEAKQQQQARYTAMQQEGGMEAKSAPKGVGSYSSVMTHLAQGQVAAEQKYGYQLDSFGHRTTAAAAPVAAAVAAPVAAAAPAPVVAAADNVFNNMFATPIAPTLSVPEVKVAEAKTAEITNQVTQQTALDDEAKRRAEAAKRRGSGISSFLTGGFKGVQQSALSRLLGA